MNAISPNPAPLALAVEAGITPQSFAQVALLVPSWPDLSDRRRRDMTSALLATARMLGRPLNTVPCDVGWLNARLFRRPPAAFGIGAKRFRNIMSGLREVLRRLGCHAPH